MDLEILNKTKFNKGDVADFLSVVFKEDYDIEIAVENVVLILSVKDAVGRHVKKAIVPVNVKNNDILGWYCSDYDICMLPLRNGKFMVKKGCNRNQPIRSLRLVF